MIYNGQYLQKDLPRRRGGIPESNWQHGYDGFLYLSILWAHRPLSTGSELD